MWLATLTNFLITGIVIAIGFYIGSLLAEGAMRQIEAPTIRNVSGQHVRFVRTVHY